MWFFLVKTNLGQFHSSNLYFWQLLNPGQKPICKNQRSKLKHIILSPKVYVFSSRICANWGVGGWVSPNLHIVQIRETVRKNGPPLMLLEDCRGRAQEQNWVLNLPHTSECSAVGYSNNQCIAMLKYLTLIRIDTTDYLTCLHSSCRQMKKLVINVLIWILQLSSSLGISLDYHMRAKIPFRMWYVSVISPEDDMYTSYSYNEFLYL